MNDRTELPWRTLAERLFSPMGLEKAKGGLFIWVLNEPLNVETIMAQDLLIGRALRVAWDSHVKNGGELDKTFVLDVFWESSGGDSRAVAALELLDAVDYASSQTSTSET